MPEVSVIIPVYNCEAFLQGCVSSIQNQTFNDFEIILIDDGSTDNSPAICDGLAKNDSRIKVFHVENGGPSKARNKGIDSALGEYFYFVDSDDSVECECLETALKHLKEKDAQLVSFGANHIRDDQTVIKSHKYKEINTNDEFKEALPDYFKWGDANSLWNKVFKADIIKQNNIRFLEGTVVEEDLMFNLQVFKHIDKMVILPEAFYNYNCRTQGSVTTKYNPNKFDCIKKAYQNELKFFTEWGVTTFDQMLHNKYLTFLSAAINNLMYKNCDKTKAQKIDTIKSYFADSVTKQCIDVCVADNRRNKMMKFLIKHSMVKTAYIIHYFVFELKRK